MPQHREHDLLRERELRGSFQESATALIAPNGECQAYLPYGTEGVLVQRLDLDAATGVLAERYAPSRYRDPEPE